MDPCHAAPARSCGDCSGLVVADSYLHGAGRPAEKLGFRLAGKDADP